MSDFIRSIPITSDMVSLWVPSGQSRAIDLIRGNHGQCYGTHPNVPVISGRNLVANGAFTTDDDPPDDWTASNATLSTESGGLVDNCMKVLDGGAGNGYGYQSIITVVGKVYSFSCWAKDIDTGQNGLIEVGTSAGNAAYYSSGAITDDTGVTYTATFTATTTTTFISLNCTSSGGTYYFDSVSLKEQQQLINPSVGWVHDGLDDYWRVPASGSLALTDKITIGTWFYYKGSNAESQQTIIGRGGEEWRFGIHYPDTNKFAFYSTAPYTAGIIQTTISRHTWHFGVFTYDKSLGSNNAKLYVDSVLKTQKDADGDLGITEDIYIGSIDPTRYFFNGYTALSFIANKAWSVAQVENFYLQTKGMFAPRG